MSTPHSQGIPLQSPASKKSTIHAGTPNQHAQSSPPRSVPSPAAVRKDQAGKTPLNHPTTSSSQGSKTVAGTPMMPNLSQQGSTASPLPLHGLGVDLGTPNHSTPGLASGMIPTMSELGITMSGGSAKRNEDEERRKKLRRILKTIGRSKGRIGEEGIARVSRSVGLANDIDVEKLSNEDRERRVGNRTISIAGNTIVIDVELKDHIPKSVQVLLPSTLEGDAATEQAERAGRILLNDLSLNTPAINSSLDRFANNLERLAKLDRLSSSTLSCFDALGGVYSSLKRLYDQELKLAQSLVTNKSTSPQDVVECQLSGRPRMHETRSLGLSIDYWHDQQVAKQKEDAMDVDNMDLQDSSSYKVRLDVERIQSGLYPPIRLSTSWLPDTFDLASKTDQIPWQEPEVTYLTSADGNSMLDDAKQLPDLRFKAIFEPPVVLPWQTALAISGSLGVDATPAFQAQSYLSLLLSLAPSASLPQQHLCTQTVLSRKDKELVPVKHQYSLSTTKHELGFRLDGLPFSHPRQVVEILPSLRQWQFVHDLCTRAFGVKTQAVQKDDEQVALTDMGDQEVVKRSALSVEVSLALMPTPTFGLIFPLINGDLYKCNVQVLANAEITVVGGKPEVSNAAQALGVCHDLGVWIEWMRARIHKAA